MQNVPSGERSLADAVARYIRHTQELYDSREWMNVRCALARLVPYARWNKQSWRRALDCLEIEYDLSPQYRRVVWARWLRFLRWAVEHEETSAQLLVEVSAFRATFRAFAVGLGRGEPFDDLTSFEPTKTTREPLSFTVISNILPSLPKLTRDVVSLLAFTGARPSDVLRLRSCDIDQSSDPWLARPAFHKTAHRGLPRVIVLPPSAQHIIDRRLTPFTPQDWIFPAPKDPRRPCTTSTIAQALARAQNRLKSQRFTLYDLRRRAAQLVRQVEGLDVAQVLLGHTSSRTTELYAPRRDELSAHLATVLEREVRL
ncbi:MAG: tyrosine-type recombinase/integrase [Phycisphaerales bacterium]|jgi:integrase|nr:tyrosine-type recombinase/integrase [Phycisphaerales bacterium]